MNPVLTEMLARYQTESLTDRKNAVKEVMQEIVLCGLSRAGFFQKAAFYGGTALRIFYGLDRFSEDLDFSLLSPEPEFMLSDYFPTLRREAAAYGLHVESRRHRSVQRFFRRYRLRFGILIGLLLAACLIFGFARSGGYELVKALGMPSAYSDLVMILPYVLTLFLLIFLSKKNQAPKALGEIYDKSKR